MNRFRWPLTASVLVIALVVGIWLFFFNGPPEKCKPVIEMLEFNRSQGALISEKAPDDANPLPTVAEDVVYHQWADGLAERAQKVSDPGLQAQAINLAQLADQFAAGLHGLRAAAQSRAPGAPPPPEAFEMYALNGRIVEQTNQLSKACS